jgi:spermidine synthase
VLITTKQLQKKFIFSSFFIAGMSAIAYQVIWERVLQRFAGAAMTSVCLITAIFMAGFCLGACLADSKFMHSIWRHRDIPTSNKELKPINSVDGLLRIYLVSLIILAALGFIYVVCQNGIFACFASIYTTSPALLSLVVTARLLLAILILLLPASLMGMSLPLLSQYLAGQSYDKDDATRLYQFNLFGSGFGAILTSFFLLPTLGITLSIAVASALYLVAAFLLLPLFQSKTRTETLQTNAVAQINSPKSLGNPINIILDNNQTAKSRQEQNDISLLADNQLSVRLATIVVLFSGLLSFMLQMVFMRLFMLVFGSCAYAYGLVLANQLFAVSVAAFLSLQLSAQTKRLGRSKTTTTLIITICVLAALLLYTLLFWVNDLPWLIFAGQRFLIDKLVLNSYLAFILSRVLIGLPVMFVPLMLLGILLPLALANTERNFEQTASVISKLYVTNTMGAVVGCLFGGVWLIPLLAQIGTSGIQLSLVGSSICLIAFAAYLAIESQMIRLIPATICSIVLIIFAVIFTPPWDTVMLSSGITFLSFPKINLSLQDFRQLLTGGSKNNRVEFLYYREGSNSTVTVSQIKKSNIIFLKTDGKMEAALPINSHLPAPTSDKLTHVLLGSLPVLLSSEKPENVLLIGYGTGVTCGSILNSPEVQYLSIAEPERAILPASAFFRSSISNYEEVTKAIGARPGRAHISLVDGRNLLSMLDRNYQVIIAQAGEPWLEGVADLYTLEFWQLAQKRLSPDGLFCQWIPLYGIDEASFVKMCLTFRTVFPNTLLFHAKNAGEVLLIGFRTKSNQKIPLINVAQIESRFKTSSMQKELKLQGINTVTHLLSMMTFSPKTLPLFLHDGESSTLTVDDQLNFDLLREAPERGMTISKELYSRLTPPTFPDEELYCNYGTTKQEKSSFIANLTAAYAESAENMSSLAH